MDKFINGSKFHVFSLPSIVYLSNNNVLTKK